MGGVLNNFGEVEVGESLEDMWTHPAKDLERTYFIRVLQGISQQKGLRMTFLSGGKQYSRPVQDFQHANVLCRHQYRVLIYLA